MTEWGFIISEKKKGKVKTSALTPQPSFVFLGHLQDTRRTILSSKSMKNNQKNSSADCYTKYIMCVTLNGVEHTWKQEQEEHNGQEINS